MRRLFICFRTSQKVLFIYFRTPLGRRAPKNPTKSRPTLTTKARKSQLRAACAA